MQSLPFLNPFSSDWDQINLSPQDIETLKTTKRADCSEWSIGLGDQRLVITHQRSWKSRPMSLLGWMSPGERIGPYVSTLSPSFCAVLEWKLVAFERFDRRSNLSRTVAFRIEGDYITFDETRKPLEKFLRELFGKLVP